MSMHEQVTSLDYFESLVTNPDEIPLTEAAASIAQVQYPNMDLQQVLFDIDQIGDRLASQCRNVTLEVTRLETCIAFFFQEMRFYGNADDYYDPNNSFLHKVLEVRQGIPISLAVIFIELANSVGLQANGVSFPGHFMIRVDLHDGTAVIDPFTGRSLSEDDLAHRLEPFRDNLPVKDGEPIPAEAFLQTAPAQDILMRMLRNLENVYQQRGEVEPLNHVQDRIEVLQAGLPV